MKFCRRCDQMIRPGELYDTQLAQSASGGARATNHVHKQCPRPKPAGPDARETRAKR